MRFAVAAALASVAVAAQAKCSPGQFWIAFTPNEDEMAVSWATNCSSTANAVNWGLTPSTLTNTVAADENTYTIGAYTSPFIHHATLTGLPTNEQIYYTVGGAASGTSDVNNFTSHRGAGINASLPTAVFAAVGDLGQTANSLDTLQHIAAAPLARLTGMLYLGDLSYADSVEPRWDSFQALTSFVTQTLPVNTVDGNHEHESTGGTVAYQSRFPMPGGIAAGRFYYSVRVGGVHAIWLSSYTAFDATSDQYKWLVAELASVDRNVTPWLVICLHAPWYNSNKSHQGEGEPMRQALEGLLYQAQVDLVLAGHVHAYERNYRAYNLKPDARGPYYITVGDGGNREGLSKTWLAQPAYSAFRQSSFGHGQLEVVNATALHWTWHQNPDLEPTIADELWIVKGASAELGTRAPALAPRGLRAAAGPIAPAPMAAPHGVTGEVRFRSAAAAARADAAAAAAAAAAE